MRWGKPGAAKPAVDALSALLGDPSDVVRREAVKTLGTIGGAAEDSLADSLEAEDDPVVIAAAEALSRLEQSNAVEPLLIRGFGDSDATVRGRAVEASALLTEWGDELRGGLVAAVNDPEPGVRAMATKVIGGVGQRSQPVAAALRTALADDDPAVRKAATEAIGKLGIEDEATVDALRTRLSDHDETVLRAALTSLAEIGEEAGASGTAIAARIQHDSPSVRSAAVRAVVKVKPHGSDVVDELTAALSDEEWSVRRDAAAALGELGSDARAAVPVLFGLLDSEIDRDAARGALREIDDAGPDAVPVLVEALQTDDRRKRFYAVMLLRKVGPEAADAVPALKRRLRESDSDRFRGLLQTTIDAIEGNGDDD